MLQIKYDTTYAVLLIATLVIGLHSTQLYAANTLEGIQWQLIELNGEELAKMHGDKQPFIFFDATKKSAAGYNGCNSYSGQYKLQGHSLTFGPVAATRRACPVTESAIELKFMAALEKTRTWEIKEGKLTLLDDTKILARFTTEKASANSYPASADGERLEVQKDEVMDTHQVLTGEDLIASDYPGS